MNLNEHTTGVLLQLVSIAGDIYSQLGPGYSEVIYHNAFEVGLRTNCIKYQSEVIVPILYNNFNIGHGRIDLLINDNIIIELKAVSNLSVESTMTQIKNYMNQYSINFGLIINFGQSSKNVNGELVIKLLIKEPTFYRFYSYQNNTFIEQQIPI